MPENQGKFNISDLEQKILEFWRKNKIFEKSIEKPAGKKPKGDYVFYDGPPFATGTPHYGHIVASAIKDAVPRYWAMRGYRVERKWGWDCHGLPIENIAEKELGINRKKEIEEMGVGKFNEFCRSKIFGYVDEWKKVIGRLGRWADMENSYKTMDVSFMESVWRVFKQLWDKGLIYESYRSMHVCPRCETTLSQQEVSEGYKDIKDISAIVKFKLIGEPNTYILAWTTTPWTLPGNVALAVGEKIDYAKVKIEKDFFILAERRIAEILKDKKYEIIEKFKGKDLIGKKYEPLFDYYLPAKISAKEGANDKSLKNRENALPAGGQGWKIYDADFVTTDEGTGVVHIAPAFGEDDFKLMEQYNLPFVQHVGMDGIIKPEVKDFSGMSVKPIGDHQKTDIEIIKNLAGRGLLFAKEKYEHSYPHCWRCDTPLINYAASSWFVNILKIKDKAIKLAKGINWSPAHIKEGRFGKWLGGARDWSVSRQRYWASAIPIWKCGKCEEIKIIGSIEDIKNNIKKSGNRYFVMRHGEAKNNALGVVNSSVRNKDKFSLTEKGEKQVLATAKKIKKETSEGKPGASYGAGIDLIFSSDFLRTRQTAEIVAKEIKYKGKIIFDERLREINMGIIDGKKIEEYRNFAPLQEKFYKTPPEGENLTELKNRAAEFLYEIDNKYGNKNILIVSHEYPIWLLFAAAGGADAKKAVEIKNKIKGDFIKTAGLREFNFAPLPHNLYYELDLHRPYIDEIEFNCVCGGKMKRISDVLDTWFDSGSMPYAQARFPAEFIAEGVDQTRAWFYYLHCIATGIKNSRAFNNAIVNGIVLAEDGKKMSKRLQNYPDPLDVINKYGADSLRLYLLSSPVMRAENLNFLELGVDEVYKKVILRLWNSYQFYELYADMKTKRKTQSAKRDKNVLDKWIIARLNQLIQEIFLAMNNYELDKATRPLGDFVEDLSTWYIRRSRERFKEEGKDKQSALATLRFVLSEFSKAIAPFMPFMAEKIYQNLGNKNSVHLAEWPKFDKKKIDKKLSEAMAETRKICSLALEARQKAGIKVRQPLSELRIKNSKLRNEKELFNLIKDEINVKETIFDKNIANEVELNIKITSELKAEGDLREFIRAVQDSRKKAGLKPEQKIILEIQANEAGRKLLKKFENEIKKSTGAKKIEFKEIIDGEKIKIDGLELKIEIKK